MKLYIGNDKSTARILPKGANQLEPVAEIKLRNVLHYAALYWKRLGYDVKETPQQIFLNFKYYRFVILKRKPFGVYIYLNPIEVRDGQYFNYISSTFDFEETKEMFREARKVIQGLLKDFAEFPQKEFSRIFFHDDWTIARKRLETIMRVKGNATIEEVINHLMNGYLEDFPQYEHYVKQVSEGDFDLVQLSVTVDVHCDNEQQKHVLFNHVAKVVMPKYKKVVWEAEHVRWRPFNNEKKTYIKDMPVVRLYIKYFDVKHKGHELLAKLKEWSKNIHAQQDPQQRLQIQAEIENALLFLKHTARFEFDFSSKESIKRRFGTTALEQRDILVRTGPRGEQIETAKNIPEIDCDNVMLVADLFHQFWEKVQEKEIDNELAHKLVQQYLPYLKLMHYERKEVAKLLEKDIQAVKKQYSRMKKEGMIDGRGNNAIITEPFRTIVNTYETKEGKDILKLLSNKELLLPYIVYSNINTTTNNNLLTSSSLNNIWQLEVTFKRRKDQDFFDRLKSSTKEFEIGYQEERILDEEMSPSNSDKLLERVGTELVLIQDLLEEGFSETLIRRLETEGELFQPRNGVLQRLG